MPPPYVPPHWGALLGSPPLPRVAVGAAPSDWFASLAVVGLAGPFAALPPTKCTRTHIRAICHPPGIMRNPPMFDWACAMAWGGQRITHGRSSFAHAHALIPKLHLLRAGGLSRADAYKLFLPHALGGGGNINGLGPAFFTKLIYFLSPHPSFFIMDQWVAKSVNMLCGSWVVRMTPNGYVANFNRCGNYAAFCWEIDQIAALLGLPGDAAEERLFSKGMRPAPIGPWRAYIDANWNAASAAFPPYDAVAMHAVYGPLTGLGLIDFH